MSYIDLRFMPIYHRNEAPQSISFLFQANAVSAPSYSNPAINYPAANRDQNELAPSFDKETWPQFTGAWNRDVHEFCASLPVWTGQRHMRINNEFHTVAGFSPLREIFPVRQWIH